jgi:uncharacterized membrane protein required for colicin V production
MLFWVLLIVSGLFAWLGVKKGLYAMFATLFCLMFSVYIGVLAAPRIIRLSHGLEQDPYYAAGCVFGMGLVIFILLWSIAYFFFIRDGEEYFPKMFERIGGGVCGFLFGYILTSLLMLLLCIMPFSRSEKLPVFCSRDEGMRFSVPAVVKTCNFIAGYSLECFDGDAESIIDYLLSFESKPEPSTPPARTIDSMRM